MYFLVNFISVDKVVLVPVKTHNTPADDSKEQPFANACETAFEDSLKVYSWSPNPYKAPFPKQGQGTALGQSSSKSGHTLVLVCTKLSNYIPRLKRSANITMFDPIGSHYFQCHRSYS